MSQSQSGEKMFSEKFAIDCLISICGLGGGWTGWTGWCQISA